MGFISESISLIYLRIHSFGLKTFDFQTHPNTFSAMGGFASAFFLSTAVSARRRAAEHVETADVSRSIGRQVAPQVRYDWTRRFWHFGAPGRPTETSSVRLFCGSGLKVALIGMKAQTTAKPSGTRFWVMLNGETWRTLRTHHMEVIPPNRPNSSSNRFPSPSFQGTHPVPSAEHTLKDWKWKVPACQEVLPRLPRGAS